MLVFTMVLAHVLGTWRSSAMFLLTCSGQLRLKHLLVTPVSGHALFTSAVKKYDSMWDIPEKVEKRLAVAHGVPVRCF